MCEQVAPIRIKQLEGKVWSLPRTGGLAHADASDRREGEVSVRATGFETVKRLGEGSGDDSRDAASGDEQTFRRVAWSAGESRERSTCAPRGTALDPVAKRLELATQAWMRDRDREAVVAALEEALDLLRSLHR